MSIVDVNKEHIIIDISPIGNVTIEAKNYSGCGCTKATEQIELVLGGGSRKKETKPEYFAPASTANSVKQVF